MAAIARQTVVAALGVRLLAAMLAGTALALWYPRRNPASEPWVGADLDAGTLLEHVARAGERGDAERWLHGAGSLHHPLYAWVTQGLAAGGGIPAWAAASLLSLAALTVTAVLLRLCLRATSIADDAATHATWLWLLLPTAPLLGWVAPWSLLAALLAATWLAALHDRRLLAGAAVAAALLTHPLGIAALPLALLVPAAVQPASAPRSAVSVTYARRRWIAVAAGIAAAIAIRPAMLDLDWSRVDPFAAFGVLAGSMDTLLTDPVPLRAAPLAHYGDALSAGMLNLTGLVLIVAVLALVPATWRRLGPGAATSCAIIAVALLLVPTNDAAPAIGALAFTPCALPALAPVACWAVRDELRRALTIVTSATLFGAVAAAAALWSPLA